jgi:hypothetical protein
LNLGRDTVAYSSVRVSTHAPPKFKSEVLLPKATRGLEPISYRGLLLSTLLHASVYMFLNNLLNALVHIANKMGLQKKGRLVEQLVQFRAFCAPAALLKHAEIMNVQTTIFELLGIPLYISME